MVRPEEIINTIPKSSIDSDGTVFAPFTYGPGISIYEGIAPTIRLFSNARSAATQSQRELINRMENFVLVKETIATALLDTWIVEVVKVMREKCWSLHIMAAQKGQPYYIAEALSQSVIELISHNGRFLALTDLGSTFAAIKAVENMEVVNDLKRDRQLSPLVTTVQGKSLGASPQEILFNSFTLAINAPLEYRSLYQGDITTIP